MVSLRAWCRTRRTFIDFVLTRILEIDTGSPVHAVDTKELPTNDRQWNSWLMLELVPHPRYAECDEWRIHEYIVRADFKLTGECLRKEVRASMTGYFLRHWHVDCSPDHQLSPIEYPLWLRNHQILYASKSRDIAPGWPKLDKNLR
jgi:hypothetical protein